MGQRIREVMTANPSTIEADGFVVEAAKIMKQEDAGVVPVTENGRLIGMVTDRDIAIRVVAEGKDPQSTSIREVASTDPVTIDPQQDLDEALRLMAQHQVRRLPVVEEDGRLVGVVAQADIAREGDDRQTGQLVEEISESGGRMSSIEGQFPRQVDDEQPQVESLLGQEPQVEERQQEEEGISKVQSSSRGRRKKRSTAKRKTAAKKSTGTRKRKTASRKRSTAKRSTAKKRGTTKKRSTAKRKTTSRKRSTAKRSTTKRRGAAKKRGTAKKRSTAKRRGAAKIGRAHV